MKKVILPFVLLSLISVGAMAQVQAALGLKAGANLSKFDKPDTKNLTSFHVGAFGLIKLTKFGIQPEMLFSQQGASYKDVNLKTVDLKTSYVNVPVMLKLYLAAGLNLQMGPQFGFLTAAKIDKTNVKSNLESSDVSANFGAGWDLPFGVTVDARFNLGLSKVDFSKVPNIPTSLDELKSRVIQVSVGYKFVKMGK